MTKEEVLRKIMELMSLEISKFGFADQIKKQWFIKKDKSVFYFYALLIYDRTHLKTGIKGFQIEPYVDIHIAEIEKYHKEITTNTEYKKEWSSSTIGNSIANLIANPDGINRKRNQSLDLYIYDGDDVKSVTDELLNQFNKVALPYFLSNNTISKVDELLNEHPKEYCVHMNNDLYRFIKGIIAAKLNNNIQTEELVKIYSHIIIERDMPEYCKEEVQKLKSILPMIGN